MGNASQCNESDKNRPELSQKPKFFFSKEFLIDKEAGRAYSSFSRRDVAQSGSALEWGSRGRRFKSFHPDQKTETPRDLRKRGSLFCFWGICPWDLVLSSSRGSGCGRHSCFISTGGKLAVGNTAGMQALRSLVRRYRLATYASIRRAIAVGMSWARDRAPVCRAALAMFCTEARIYSF